VVAARIVKQIMKDSDGDVTALCNSGESWSPRLKTWAILDIKSETIEYRVGSRDGPLVEIVRAPTGDYLRSGSDSTTGDNLDRLPELTH
jgi:uncharacterized protein DUF3892